MVKISKNVSYYCPLFSWVWQYSLHYSCHILKWDTGTKFSGLSIAMSIKSLMDYSGLFLFFWLIMDEHLHSTVAVLELNVNIKQSKSNMSVIFCKYAAVFFTLNYVMWWQSNIWFAIKIASYLIPQPCKFLFLISRLWLKGLEKWICKIKKLNGQVMKCNLRNTWYEYLSNQVLPVIQGSKVPTFSLSVLGMIPWNSANGEMADGQLEFY